MIGLPNLRCTAFWLLLLWCGHAASQPVVILRGDGHYPPDEMLVDGELSGFHIEVIQAVARQLALEIRFESVPWARAQYMLRNGQGDALSFLAHNKERAQYAVFLPGNILSSIDHYLVYHPDQPPAFPFTGSLAQLHNHSVGIRHGYSYGQVFDDAREIFKVVVQDDQQMLKLLRDGRIDLAVMNAVDFFKLKQQPGFAHLQKLPVPLSTTPNYLAFSRGSEHSRDRRALAQRFSQAMIRFRQTPEYQRLYQKYNKHFQLPD